MAAVVRVGPEQRQRLYLGLPGGSGAQGLKPSSVFQAHLQGAGWEGEHLGLELMPIWGSGVADSD